eukprot:1434222-Amphidinium_carterae.2
MDECGVGSVDVDVAVSVSLSLSDNALYVAILIVSVKVASVESVGSLCVWGRVWGCLVLGTRQAMRCKTWAARL